MRLGNAWLLLLLGLAVAGCSAGSAYLEPAVIRPATPPPRAERPVYQLGDRWIRNDGVFEVTRIHEDRYVFGGDRGREIEFSRDLVPIAWGRDIPEWNFDSPPPVTWPLEVGKQGEGEGFWRFFEWQEFPGRRGLPRDFNDRNFQGSSLPTREWRPSYLPAAMTWTVEAYEPVRVPAGTFDAYRLLFTVKLLRDGPAARPRWSLRAWYAPAARQLVKAEGPDSGLLGFHVVAVEQPVSSPLVVALTGPGDQARVAKSEVVLTGRITAGKGIARVTVTVNGEEVARREERAVPPEMRLDIPVRLRAGRNVLLVSATDAAGETREAARTVIHDPAAEREAVEAVRSTMLAARGEGTTAGAEHLVPQAWAAASAREREADTALAGQRWDEARTAYQGAEQAYARAAEAAREAARLAERQAAARQARDAAAAARQAAEIAGAPRLAADPWGRALQLEREAQPLLDLDAEGARIRFRDAQTVYREAEATAAAQAAAAEQARLAALRRQLEAAQQAATATAGARRAAEQAGAARLAADLLAAATAREREGQAALDRQDYATARSALRDAELGFQRAAQAAAAETAQLAALERQRAEAEALRADTARAAHLAAEAEAERHAASALAEARDQERAAQAAAGRQGYARALSLFRDARLAYERAATTARQAAAALPPLQIRLTAPAEQARLEQARAVLAGVVGSGRGVRRVVVSLNSVEVARLDESTPRPSVPLDVPLALREGANLVVVTATEADGALHQEVRTVHYEPLVPLTVAVRYPEDHARLTDEASVLAAVVSSSKGVTRLSVTVNGAEVHQQTERRPQRSLALAIPLTLKPGSNAIVLTAAEPDGTVRQDRRTVVYAPPTDAAPQSTTYAAREPTRWAVVVGVGQYAHPQIPRLQYSVRDADAVYQLLTGPGGFKKEHVLLLTDTTDRKPTLRNLKWALGSFLARSARKEDSVLIFFAGHGAPEIDPRGLEKDGLSKYLVPIDADPEDLYVTGLPMEELQTIFDRIEAERVVAFLDTCYSGAAGGRTFAARRTRAATLDAAFLDQLTRARGRVIVTASRPSEVSVELPSLGHGLFTYYLLQGLRGAADSDRDEVVALQELYQYVEREVTARSRALGGNQHPVLKGELEGTFPLIKVPR